MGSGDDLMARVRADRAATPTDAFGTVRDAHDRRASDDERAVRLAADNLLDKALQRVREGDEARARRFVDRALALGSGEEGPLAVHLFLWDGLREASLGELGWVDRAEAVRLEGPARREWLAALRALQRDGELDPADARRIRGFAGGTGSDHEPFAGVDVAARTDAVLALLAALVRVAG